MTLRLRTHRASIDQGLWLVYRFNQHESQAALAQDRGFQGKTPDAAAANGRFRRARARADVAPTSSSF